MLAPKQTKHRKTHRLRGQQKKRIATRGNTVAFGEIGLKAVSPEQLTSRQIESARRAITRKVKRGGKIWVRVFPDQSVTSKGSEAPMGSGKGAPDYFKTQVVPGHIIFEMAGADMALMREALKLAAYKLPFKCKIVTTEL
jgi:large subunit ribosomal protein L16